LVRVDDNEIAGVQHAEKARQRRQGRFDVLKRASRELDALVITGQGEGGRYQEIAADPGVGLARLYGTRME
jgi:hypothetical protein